MKKTLLSLAAAAAIMLTTAMLPSQANAIGVGTAAAIDNALNDLNEIENVAYVCRWRYNRRVCAWVPNRRVYRPYRAYRPYRVYRPYRYYRRW